MNNLALHCQPKKNKIIYELLLILLLLCIIERSSILLTLFISFPLPFLFSVVGELVNYLISNIDNPSSFMRALALSALCSLVYNNHKVYMSS